MARLWVCAATCERTQEGLVTTALPLSGRKGNGDMPHKGHVVHHLEGRRLRVRVPGKRRDQVFFRDVKERLNRIEDAQVHVEPLTGSVLVYYSGSITRFFQQAADAGLSELLEIETGMPEPIAEGLQTFLSAQVKTALFVALLLFGGFKVLRV
jgi:hypothetical protein